MMGCEPIAAALDSGADVVLAGRSSDTAIFAAYPLMKGAKPGPVWHAAKILECGAAAVEYRPSPDCMFAWVKDDQFIVRAPNPALKCTPVSVAAHALYENGNPYRILEPAGALDLTNAQYEQLPEGAVLPLHPVAAPDEVTLRGHRLAFRAADGVAVAAKPCATLLL